MRTIFAISSGTPPAAIAVMRLSGPDATATATALCGSLPRERRAGLRTIRDPGTGAVLDRALILAFRAPRTATGEDLVELHLHGGRAVVAAVARALASFPALRPAEPGEFTRRALANGRIDLTEAEGLGDLLAAETETRRRAAMSAADGAIRRRIDEWAGRALALSALVEAEIDFPDEDDVDYPDMSEIAARAAVLGDEIGTLAAQPPVERLRDGICVVLAGPPNSGKSTLLNALVDRDAAIVSPLAGTTRDRIDAPVGRNGIAYVVTDTAGLAGETDDIVERIGIDRALSAMRSADIVLWLGDDGAPAGALRVHARADLPDRAHVPAGALSVSATTGQGMIDLWQRIETMAVALLPRLDGISLNRRQAALADQAATSLRAARDVRDPLLVAEYLRQALTSFDAITGRANTEAMLDALFSGFCIGK